MASPSTRSLLGGGLLLLGRRLLLSPPPPQAASCPRRRAAHIRSGRHLEYVLYPAATATATTKQRQRPPAQPPAAAAAPGNTLAPASRLVTREDLRAAWRSVDEADASADAAATVADVTERLLSVDCRDMSAEDLARCLRAVAGRYWARHLGAAGEAALADLRADPRLALLQCMAAARCRHLGPAQLCRLLCDLCALRCHPDVSAVPLALLNSAVNDLSLARLLSTLWRLRAAADSLPAGPEAALLRRQALAHLRARLHELEAPPDCVAAARAVHLFGDHLAPDETAGLLAAAQRGAALASALDPARLEAALAWRDLLPAALPPALRHLSECAQGMFHLGPGDLDGLICAQEAVLAALAADGADPAPSLAAGLRDLCALGPRVLARLPAAARPDDLVEKFQRDRLALLPLALAAGH